MPVANCQLIARLCFAISTSDAGVVELVDALDSKSCSERSAGSIPAARTIISFLFASLTHFFAKPCH